MVHLLCPQYLGLRVKRVLRVKQLVNEWMVEKVGAHLALPGSVESVWAEGKGWGEGLAHSRPDMAMNVSYL